MERKMKEIITIFTPTYNREIELKRLYKSLCKQTCDLFEWLIIDDGSIDNTEQLIKDWIDDSTFNIRYVKQENKGKSFSHNVGTELTNTELFTCVDSDDYLTETAVESIIKCWNVCRSTDIGILAKRDVTGLKREVYDKEIHISLRSAYSQYGIIGDTMLIYRTDIIKKYKFPYFEGEKFVPENYLYDLLDREGTLYFLNEVLYKGEYLADGYTKNMSTILKTNPKGYLAYINQRLQMDLELKYKMADTIRYISMAKVMKSNNIIRNSIYPIVTLLMYPLGVLHYYRKYCR